jgi:hypothetical protein
MKRLIFVVLFIHYFPISLFAASSQLSQVLYNSVHFAENGNDIVVEIDKIQRALADGADPNWINTKDQRHQSVLENYITLISLSRDPVINEKGMTAIILLFKHGAKLQYSDRAILFFPISRGKYEIVKILLENGASATFWPKDDIGSDLSPIEQAAASGDKRIIDCL